MAHPNIGARREHLYRFITVFGHRPSKDDMLVFAREYKCHTAALIADMKRMEVSLQIRTSKNIYAEPRR